MMLQDMELHASRTLAVAAKVARYWPAESWDTAIAARCLSVTLVEFLEDDIKQPVPFNIGRRPANWRATVIASGKVLAALDPMSARVLWLVVRGAQIDAVAAQTGISCKAAATLNSRALAFAAGLLSSGGENVGAA